MWTERFDPHAWDIPVNVRVSGPLGDLDLVFLVDTGTPCTVINAEQAIELGYSHEDRRSFTTSTGVGGRLYGYRFPAQRVVTLGMDISPCTLICEPLPEGVYGLIGLDLLRSRVLMLDFIRGALTLSG